jgi:hypothetical protein
MIRASGPRPGCCSWTCTLASTCWNTGRAHRAAQQPRRRDPAGGPARRLASRRPAGGLHAARLVGGRLAAQGGASPGAPKPGLGPRDGEVVVTNDVTGDHRPDVVLVDYLRGLLGLLQL